MPTTYTTSLRLAKPATGELSGTWGSTVNTGVISLVDEALAGYTSIAMSDADYTLSASNGASDEARQMYLKFTGTLTANRNIIVPAVSKMFFINNMTTGGFSLVVKTSGGTGPTIFNGNAAIVFCDGTNVLNAFNQITQSTTTGTFTPSVTNTYNLGSTTKTFANTYSTTFTGTGVAFANSAVGSANTLDWYEEGTFSPTLAGNITAGSWTYALNSGVFTRIGNRVFFDIYITTSGRTAVPSGQLGVTNFPYVPAEYAFCHIKTNVGASSSALPGVTGQLTGALITGQNKLALFTTTNGDSAVYVSTTPGTSVISIGATGSYKV